MTLNLRPAVISICVAMLFAACNSKPEKTAVIDNTNTAKELIDLHFKLLNNHDLKGLVSQYAEKAKITTTDWDGVSFGPQGADQIFHALFYTSPDAKYLVDNMISNDSTVVVEYDVIGLRDKLESSVRHDSRNCSIFYIRESKISSEATYANTRLYHSK
jgi:D-serine dehydratase